VVIVLRSGYDADVVLWDCKFDIASSVDSAMSLIDCPVAHPLSIGASPLQVLIDGKPQLPTTPIDRGLKRIDKQQAPLSGNYVWQIKRAEQIARDSEEDTGIKEILRDTSVTFFNVSTVYKKDSSGKLQSHKIETDSQYNEVVIGRHGDLLCMGECGSFAANEYTARRDDNSGPHLVRQSAWSSAHFVGSRYFCR
jgi:hypothetical protein